MTLLRTLQAGGEYRAVPACEGESALYGIRRMAKSGNA